MSTDLVLIAKRLMGLVQVDQPCETARVSGDDVVLIEIVLFSRDVASIRYVFDPQRRLQLYLIALFLKRPERL